MIFQDSTKSKVRLSCWFQNVFLRMKLIYHYFYVYYFYAYRCFLSFNTQRTWCSKSFILLHALKIQQQLSLRKCFKVYQYRCKTWIRWNMKLKTKTKIYFLVDQSKEAANYSGMDSFLILLFLPIYFSSLMLF